LHEKGGAVLDVIKYLPVFSMGGACWLDWHLLCSLESKTIEQGKYFKQLKHLFYGGLL
jgi:hypothetical protein